MYFFFCRFNHHKLSADLDSLYLGEAIHLYGLYLQNSTSHTNTHKKTFLILDWTVHLKGWMLESLTFHMSKTKHILFWYCKDVSTEQRFLQTKHEPAEPQTAPDEQDCIFSVWMFEDWKSAIEMEVHLANLSIRL